MSAPRARVLLAEDEPTVAHPLVDLLAGEGCEVRWVRAVRDTRELLRSYSPDILLLDVSLDTDGLELFQALRFTPDHPPGGVVVLTEAGETRTRERAQQLGAAAVVTKPVNADRLLAVVDDLMAFI